jgi:hypothetical protein
VDVLIRDVMTDVVVQRLGLEIQVVLQATDIDSAVLCAARVAP